MPRELLESMRQSWRDRCYGCHRPTDRCFCDRIPSIANQTEVIVLQHIRERFHPFNTARILKRSLLNSRLVVDHSPRVAEALMHMELAPDVGLLYPGPNAQLLEGMPKDQHPSQLIVLDGTWHHTKTLVRDIPQLQQLPCYRLAPSQPSRYSIRREPNAECLSTLEATVAALRCLEPETLGFDQLVAAFEGMIESQLTLPMTDYGWRRNHRRKQKRFNVPHLLKDSLNQIVVIYGESAPGITSESTLGNQYDQPDENSDSQASAKSIQVPVYWVAERLVTGERFECIIKPPRPLSTAFLGHLDLKQTAFEKAISGEEFRNRWSEFLRPADSLAFFYSNIPKLLAWIGGSSRKHLHLKSVRLDANLKHKCLEQILASLNIQPPRSAMDGRAGKRLADTLALVSYLNQLD